MKTILPHFRLGFVAAVLLGWALTARAAEEKIWHIKAVHPEGRLLDVKAIDKAGKLYAVI